MMVNDGVPLFLANFPGDSCSMPRRPLMVRAARCCELRRSCDGVAAATELRRPLLLRVASRRDALNEEPASFPPGLIQISMVVAHSPRPPPWPRNFITYLRTIYRTTLGTYCMYRNLNETEKDLLINSADRGCTSAPELAAPTLR